MIRKATKDEIQYITDMTEKVKKIMHEVDQIPQWDYDYPNYSVFAKDVDEETLFVYDVNGTIAGYIVFNAEEDDANEVINYREYSKYKVIHRFAVDPDFRGQGVAKALVNYIFDIAKEENLEAVRIDTNSKNKQMNNLILSMGFEYRGQMALKENRPLWNAYDIILS